MAFAHVHFYYFCLSLLYCGVCWNRLIGEYTLNCIMHIGYYTYEPDFGCSLNQYRIQAVCTIIVRPYVCTYKIM